MRELIGKILTKDANVTEEVYLSELIRCRECQRTVPIGIEVVRSKGMERLKRFSVTDTTAAHTVMIMK
jgi:hypothetical protein